MSGGYFEYKNDDLMYELFHGCETCKEARKADPFEDTLMSEFAFDFMNIIGVLDKYKSCDISEIPYRIAIKEFKDKWFSKELQKDLVEKLIIENCEDLKADLLNSFNIKPKLVPEKCSCGAGYPDYGYPDGICEFYCKSCGKSVQADSLEEALEAWNRIAADAVSKDEVQKIKK